MVGQPTGEKRHMVLYTCGMKKHAGSLPLLAHACGAAAKALDDAGHAYDMEIVGGYKGLPWTRRGGQRDEIASLTGQKDVPVLLLEDGTAIAGSGAIVEWARANPAGEATAA
jgi:glutathione S-transferase